jgi:hypothetical protein
VALKAFATEARRTQGIKGEDKTNTKEKLFTAETQRTPEGKAKKQRQEIPQRNCGE